MVWSFVLYFNDSLRLLISFVLVAVAMGRAISVQKDCVVKNKNLTCVSKACLDAPPGNAHFAPQYTASLGTNRKLDHDSCQSQATAMANSAPASI